MVDVFNLVGSDERTRPVVIEICDSEEKINAFLPVLDEMNHAHLACQFPINVTVPMRAVGILGVERGLHAHSRGHGRVEGSLSPERMGQPAPAGNV
jgi:Uncharacterized ACR, COG1993